MGLNRRDLMGVALVTSLSRAPSASATTPSSPAAPDASVSPIALLTLLEGDAFLLRGNGRFALAQGVVLLPEDVLELPAETHLARLEFTDGTTLALGPDSRLLLAPRLSGERTGARAYLLSGWAKLGAAPGVASRLSTPFVDVATTAGTLVLSVQPANARLFAEAGEIALRRAGAPPLTLKAGESLELSLVPGAGAASPGRPPPAFIAAMPRAFRDVLPSHLAKFQDRTVPPRRLGDLAYADARPWLDAEPALRRANLPRWRPLARDPEFRRALAADLKSHLEWAPILTPPRPKSSP